jgi:hypothetical protein
MKFRRIFTPVVLMVTLLVQFLPGTAIAPRPVAAAACNAAQFVADMTIPDGTVVAPGAAMVKTWRLKNIGSCTWSTSYAIVFYGGTKMGAPSVVYLPTSVAPGATVDVTVNMTAPASAGHYRGYWMLRNASSAIFGVGPYGTWTFFIDIVVAGGSTSSAYDFVANYASATWTSSSGASVQHLAAPTLEDGSTGPAGLLTIPQNITDGYIQGVYPALTVQSGDHFLSIINCQYGATGCYVTFQLNYEIGSGPVYTLKSFKEKLDGMYYNLNVDLSSLAGQNVNFILKVLASGSPTGDRAVWAGARIARAGGSPPLPPTPPLSSTCDKAWFVSDVTIPDGTVLAAGTPFTKTWELQNVGSCTWSTAYKLAFVGWDRMGASATAYNLPTSVAPGGTIDLSVNLTAPSTVGNFYGYWILQNASGVNFGVGASGTSTFFVNIKVNSTSGLLPSTTSMADTPDPSTIGQSVAVNVTVTGAGTTPTGTVAITGADTNCSFTLSSGSGTCNVVFSTSGTRTLTAAYSGDVNYTGSSNTASHSVSTGLAASTTSIADTPDPSIPGELVAVAVTVTGAGTTPTGTVNITGADTNCSFSLSSSGSGTCNVVFTTGGTRTIIATYLGNANYAGSSDSESHIVTTGLAVSSTSITNDNPHSSTPGIPVVVSFTVSGAGLPVPTGTVTVTGADTPCNAILLSGGSGSCSVTFNTTGTKPLTAVYSGDGNYAPSSSSPASHIVIQGPSTTTINSHLPNPSTPGQAVAVNFTVTGAGVTPTGTMTITGANVNCTIQLSGGSGSCNVVFNTIGTPNILATYSGDSNYSSSSDTKGHIVRNATTISITSHNPDWSIPGQVVAVYVKVTGAGAAPTGTVDITSGSITCNLTLVLADNGIGGCTLTFNTAGAKLLTATYNGDGAGYAPSTSSPVTHNVDKGLSTTHITVNAHSAPYESVTVSVTVSGIVATPPTGSVGISVSGVPSASCTITLSSSGTGNCPLVFPTAGTFTITATYSGDGNYSTSQDTALHTVP